MILNERMKDRDNWLTEKGTKFVVRERKRTKKKRVREK